MDRAEGAAIAAAEAWLRARGVPYRRPSPHHLKVGSVNFYPGKGTIFVDREAARRREIGLSGLQQVLAALGLLAVAH
jgi:hypothetical protein